MANEELSIKNRALSTIGAPRLSSLGEVSDTQDQVTDHWNGDRQSFLSMHPWDGATTIVDLTIEGPKPTDAPDRYVNAFEVPGAPLTFLQGWRVNNIAQENSQDLWEIFTFDDTGQKTFVMTDNGAAKLEYTYDLDTDLLLAKLQPLAVTALVKWLSVSLARAYSKKEQDIGTLQRQAELALRAARRKNSRQQKRKHTRSRPLVDARLNRRTFGRGRPA